MHDAAATFDDRRGEGLAIGLGVRERVTLLDERSARHQVLAPGDDADAEEEQAAAERGAELPGLGVDPVARAETGETERADDEADTDDALDELGVARGRLQVRVVRRQTRQ